MHTTATAFAGLLAVGAIFVSVVTRAADPGDQVFGECAACHSADGTNSVGPTLKGVVGRRSASVPGFAYSSAMKRAQVQWTAAELDKYLADPQATIPGNAMPYAGMADASQRHALITYLATLK